MCTILNGKRRFRVGRSMSQCLVTQKGVVIIDIGRLRSIGIFHREIKIKSESSSREKPYGIYYFLI